MAEMSLNANDSANALQAAANFLADSTNKAAILNGREGYRYEDLAKIKEQAEKKVNSIGSTLAYNTESGSSILIPYIAVEGIELLGSKQDDVPVVNVLSNLSFDEKGTLHSPEQLEVLSQYDLAEIAKLTQFNFFNGLTWSSIFNPNHLALSDLIEIAMNRINGWTRANLWAQSDLFHKVGDFNLEKDTSDYKKISSFLKAKEDNEPSKEGVESEKHSERAESQETKEISDSLSAESREQVNHIIEMAKQQSEIKADAYEAQLRNQIQAQAQTQTYMTPFYNQNNNNNQNQTSFKLSEAIKEAYATVSFSSIMVEQAQRLFSNYQEVSVSKRQDIVAKGRLLLLKAEDLIEDAQSKLHSDNSNPQTNQIRSDLYNQLISANELIETKKEHIKALTEKKDTSEEHHNSERRETEPMNNRGIGNNIAKAPFWQTGGFWGGLTGSVLGGLGGWASAVSGVAPWLLGFLPETISSVFPPVGAALLLGGGITALGGWLGHQFGGLFDNT